MNGTRRQSRVKPRRKLLNPGPWMWVVALAVIVLAPSAAALGAGDHSTGEGRRLGELPQAYGAAPSVGALKVKVTANPASLTLGNSTNLTAVVTGGAPWFHFNWTLLPVGCTGGNRSSLNCTPSEIGTFIVSVSVNDSGGRTSATNATSVVVSGKTSPASPALSATTLYVFAGVIGIAAAGITALVLVIFTRRRHRRPPPNAGPMNPYVPPPPPETP